MAAPPRGGDGEAPEDDPKDGGAGGTTLGEGADQGSSSSTQKVCM